MKPVYLVSGNAESLIIYNALKTYLALPEKPIVWQDYRFNKKDLPILITGAGYEHHFSHLLSKAIASSVKNKKNSLKLMFDAHNDLDSYGELNCTNHLDKTIRENIFREVLIYGALPSLLCPDLAEDFNLSEIKRRTNDYKTFFGSSPSKKRVTRIKNKLTHLSIDFDVIPKEPYCAESFSFTVAHGKEMAICNRNRRNNKKDTTLAKHFKSLRADAAHIISNIETVIENNEIMALDLTGLAPHYGWHHFTDGDITYAVFQPNGSPYVAFSVNEDKCGYADISPEDSRKLFQALRLQGKVCMGFERGVQQYARIIAKLTGQSFDNKLGIPTIEDLAKDYEVILRPEELSSA